MGNKLLLSSSPHITAKTDTTKIMLDVLIALVPVAVASMFIYGFHALVLIADAVTAAVLAEYVSRKVMKRSNTLYDLSAVVTGVLLAFNLPPRINPLYAAFGAVAAIVVAKQMFGGIGNNFVNPALAGRIILLASFPAAMTSWVLPINGSKRSLDAVSCATPLAMHANGESVPLRDLLLGTTGGCLGETCAAAILIGGVYLIIRRVISPVIPLVYVGTVAVLAFLLGDDPIFHIFSGGLLLGAFFMATDYTTSPVTKVGKYIYAVGCGVLTILIRCYGNLPEGVSFSIVIMNILTPLIERATVPKPFGEGGVRHGEA